MEKSIDFYGALWFLVSIIQRQYVFIKMAIKPLHGTFTVCFMCYVYWSNIITIIMD